MRSILVQAGRDAGMANRLDTAAAIARAHNGHLTVLIDTPVSRYVTVDPYGGTYVAREALDEALANDEELAKAFAGRLQNDDVPFDVQLAELEPVDALASAANLADLVVVSRECGFCGDLAIETRTPVLVLPANTRLAVPLRAAAIAWDGSDQSAAALRASVSLLQGCDAVSVITVTDAKATGFPPTEALRYLSRHGIKAELCERPKSGSIEQTIATEAVARHAELLVMGAYGHSRAREFMFGGVTRYFLREGATLPLLIAH